MAQNAESSKEQLSIIIRLDSNGDIVERLLRFVDVSAHRTAASISRVVKSILEVSLQSLLRNQEDLTFFISEI